MSETPETPDAAAELRELRHNVHLLLSDLANHKKPCKACDELLYFVRTPRGVWIPYDDHAENHLARCPKAEEFRRAPARFNRPDGRPIS